MIYFDYIKTDVIPIQHNCKLITLYDTYLQKYDFLGDWGWEDECNKRKSVIQFKMCLFTFLISSRRCIIEN